MRAHGNQVWKLAVGGLCGVLLAGCATNVGKSVSVSEERLAKYSTLTAKDAVTAFDKRIYDAINSDMPFLAPNYFREADKILLDSQNSLQKKPKNELINDIAKGDAILDKGMAMMAIVQKNFSDELKLKEQLDKEGADKIYPKEYQKAIGELSGLIEKVELEKADKIDKDKAELNKIMQALDVKTVQYATLHDSDVINQDTRSKDGDKQAAATLVEALRVYQDATTRIAQAPHDEEAVKRAGSEALFAARHARYASERMLALQNQFKVSVEKIVLQEEDHLLSISTALAYKDLRDQPMETQVTEIARVAGELAQSREKQQKSEQTLGAANNQIQDLEKHQQEVGVQLGEKDAQLTEKVAQLSQKDAQLAEKTTQLNEKISLLGQKDAQLAEKTAQLSQKDAQLVEKSTQLAEKDAQLTVKDEQIKTLDGKLAQAEEKAISAAKPKAANAKK